MRHERIRVGHVEAQLARALVDAAHEAGIAAGVEDHHARPWASATFVGAQHGLTLVTDGATRFADWLAALPDAAFTLRGHVVASVAVDAIDGPRTRLAVLTLEDG